jgi:hypothetical protein
MKMIIVLLLVMFVVGLGYISNIVSENKINERIIQNIMIRNSTTRESALANYNLKMPVFNKTIPYRLREKASGMFGREIVSEYYFFGWKFY